MSVLGRPPDVPSSRLAAFVDELADLMDMVVQAESVLPADLRSSFRDIQSELRGAAERTASFLRGPQAAEANLDRVGLTGRQLDLKLGRWEAARMRVLGFARDIGQAENPLADLPPADVPRVRRAIIRALQWANRILGSLLAAFPGLDGAEILKEGKEAFEGAISDTDEDARG